MDYDLAVVTGIVLVVLALPLLAGAYAAQRRPYGAGLLLVLGAGLVGLALWQRPGAYGPATIPDTFLRVISSYL